MAVNKPIIAGKPAIQRTSLKVQPVPMEISSTYGLSESTPSEDPTREGQTIFVWHIEGYLRVATMYVCVDIGGVLTWKRIKTGSTVNGYTGQAFDPIYD